MTGTQGLRETNQRIDAGVAGLIAQLHRRHGLGRMLLLVVLAFALFGALAPGVFLTGLNLQNMALAVPEIGLLAVAMMIAMLTGGIDLSLVSIANLTAITISTTYT